ncbi:MAG TPA: IclR family transcriptional regulator [Xanthobacteraceae bacterium]|nr:IclR family transcriptional regulator [Xanthobacteraceae bacterium]
MTAKSNIDYLATVERTMRIVEHLSDARNGLSVSEIARFLDVNKSIAFRILATLETLHYIYQDPVTQLYRLTYRISNLALRQLANSRILDQCVAPLRALAERSGELVRLAVIENDRPVWIHSESGVQRRLQVAPTYGLDISLHSHATAKAWLFTLPDEEVERLIGHKRLKDYTKHTITTLRALKGDLAEARQRGFALSYEEHELGVGTVAAPIIVENVNGTPLCVGVVSLAAPVSRMDRVQFIQAGHQVVEATHLLAEVWPSDMAPQRLGHSPASKRLR